MMTVKVPARQISQRDDEAAGSAREALDDAWLRLETAMREECPSLCLLTSEGALKRLKLRALAHEMERVREFLVTPMKDEW